MLNALSLILVFYFFQTCGIGVAQRSDPPPRLSAIWANDGGDKVTSDEMRGSRSAQAVVNPVWDGTTVHLEGARNEVVDFDLILESQAGAGEVSVSLDELTGPGGAKLRDSHPPRDHLFNWNGRQIESFYIRYLPIRGLGLPGYEVYDERQIPRRFQRPWTGLGVGKGNWGDRPDHDKMYPDIAVPYELVKQFSIRPDHNQSIWFDIFLPPGTPAGIYRGEIAVRISGRDFRRVPVELRVLGFSLPDTPGAKTMLYYSEENLQRRYIGGTGNDNDPTYSLGQRIRDRHFQLAHRHRISLIDGDCVENEADAPCHEWNTRLDGTLFNHNQGYDGPGVGVGNGVYSIGSYGNWYWRESDEHTMWEHANRWVNWFENHSPQTETFLYLVDESSDYSEIEKWSNWLHHNPGPGKKLRSFATIPLPEAVVHTPSLDIVASTIGVGQPEKWQAASEKYTSGSHRFYAYNGVRPASGSFQIDDDGTALRELVWGQYKKGINRWFYWESTYYDNIQAGLGATDVFEDAHTFGHFSGVDPVLGRTGMNYGNGEGVLFYPGTDRIFPASSYNVEFPFASLRLKYWRKGIQDYDYLVMAAKKDPARVRALVDKMVPKVLWEYGVTDPNDPTWVRTDISWPTDPAKWIEARRELVAILEGR